MIEVFVTFLAAFPKCILLFGSTVYNMLYAINTLSETCAAGVTKIV